MLRRCLELNPNYATAVAKYATSYLSLLDRYEEASDWLSRALVLDPLSPSMDADMAIISALRGLDELFEQEAARVLEMDPANPNGAILATHDENVPGSYLIPK